MRPNTWRTAVLLSLTALTSSTQPYTSAYAFSHSSPRSAYEDGSSPDALPSSANIDNAPGANEHGPYIDLPGSSFTALTLVKAIETLESNQQKNDNSLISLLKRNYAEMPTPQFSGLLPRQESTPPPPPTQNATNSTDGSTGPPTMSLQEWDAIVDVACVNPMRNLSMIVTTVTDPAGVGVCYNIPFYDGATGDFASDLRLYKIARGSEEWEGLGTRMSLSVQYEGARVQLAAAPGTGGNTGGATDGAAAAKLRKRQTRFDTEGVVPQPLQVRLVQTLRFVGRVNPDVLANETMRANPDVMKLVLTPLLTLVGVNTDGNNINASVAAGQVNFVTGAFNPESLIRQEIIAAPAPFVLPGTAISIVPVGMYLFSVYMVLFVAIVGIGSWERYQFRMVYRRKRSDVIGKNGVGKI